MIPRIFLTLAAIGLLSSCAAHLEKKAFSGLAPGMTRAEVENLLGPPEATWRVGEQLMLVYDFKERGPLPNNGRPFVVAIRNHRVVEYGGYDQSKFPSILEFKD